MKNLIWEETDLYNPKEINNANFTYHHLDDRHKKEFKTHRAKIEIFFDEKELFSTKMWGFSTHRIILFDFYISPRYVSQYDFLNLEYPYMSVHRYLNSNNNNHLYLKSVEEGKECAEKLYQKIFSEINKFI